MERIVFLDRASVQADFRSPNFAHEWVEYPMTDVSEVVERLHGATVAITNKVPLRESELKRLPRLRMIAVAATGTDCVDTDYCRERGIIVSNVSGYSRRSVPEHVFALLFALRRSLFAYREEVKNGKWQTSKMFCLLDHRIHELYGSTLGIVGYGDLGRAVEKIALAFGMKILIAERQSAQNVRGGRASFEKVLRESDALTLHCPLTDETRNLIGESELSMMRRNCILINCGRGGLVDENALANALQSGAIGGAGVDVLSDEPPSAGNPLLDLDLPNLIVTPHVAWASREAMQTLADQVVANLERNFKIRE